MADPQVKQIKIKTGVVKRLTKEKEYYEKEVESDKKRIEDKKAKGADEYEIRKQEEVLQESIAMVPERVRALKKGMADLSSCLEEAKGEHSETPEYTTAQEVMVAAEKCVKDFEEKQQQQQ